MKKFEVPEHYKSSIVQRIKLQRTQEDRLKKNLTPSEINLGAVQFYLPRNFGFCYGVENAISLSNEIIENNHEKKRVFLLSELIHNPIVNQNLIERGVQFLMHNDGTNIIPFSELTAEDIVIIPAFGTTIAIENELKNIGIDIQKYYSTCPFVEKVWKKGKQLIDDNYTIIIHGKPEHEETKATFSHVTQEGNPCLIIRDQAEAMLLAQYIRQEKNQTQFEQDFKHKYTSNFQIQRDLKKIGVINQTTMLASETQEIAEYLKQVLINFYQLNNDNLPLHFSDTKDTLCYATNENQKAVEYMVKHQHLDVIIVIGGHNSSNTCNLYKIAHQYSPSFFLISEADVLNQQEVRHFDIYQKTFFIKQHSFFQQTPLKVGIIIGASCPDYQIDIMIKKIMSFYEDAQTTNTKLLNFIPKPS